MMDGLAHGTPLTDQQRQEALDRFHLLQPCLEEGVPLAEVARAREIPYRTAKRWLRQYRQQGLAGLVRQPRKYRGQPRLPAPLVRLIEGLALRRPPPSVASIQRQVAGVAPAQGWPTPSYDCVYDIVRGLDPGLVEHVVASDTAHLRGGRDAQRLADRGERDIHIALAGPDGQNSLAFDLDVPLLQGRQGRCAAVLWFLTRHA